MRLILDGSISSEFVPGAIQRAEMGIYVCTHEAFDQGAFLDPSGEQGQDWWYWTSKVVLALGGATNQVVWSADIRTKRLLRAGYKLVVVFNNFLNDSIVVIDLAMRILWAKRA